MTNNSSIRKASLTITVECLFFVFLAYMVDVLFARLVFLNLELATLITVIPLKIILFGGIYGFVCELVSGEELTISWKKFTDNVSRYWKIYAVVFTAPFFIHSTLAILLGQGVLPPLQVVYALINILLLYILALYIYRDKYLKPLGIKLSSIKIDAKFCIDIIYLLSLYLFFFWVPYATAELHFEFPRITMLFTNFISLWTFIYFVVLINRQYPDVGKQFDYKKEIFLINPLSSGVVHYFASLVFRPHPPFFVVLKALSPKDYRFRKFNRYPMSDRFYVPDKLVAITCYTSNCNEAYLIARKFKEAGSTVVMGGPHVSYLPDEALEYCDCVVIGEVEGVWQNLVEDYEKGELKKTYSGSPLNEYHDLVHQELLQSEPNIIKDFLETTRGCKFRCRFCTVPSLSGGSVRKKPVFDVVELLQKLKHHRRPLMFIDNNIYSDPAYAKELFKALKPLKIKWATQCTIDMAKNDEMLKLAKESGCVQLLIGFEVSESTYGKSEGGKLAMVDRYLEYAKKIKKLGIQIKAHFIFGFQTDRLGSLFRFWKFCFAIHPAMTVLSVLTPYPGSGTYQDMMRENNIANLNWKHYGCQSVVIKHPHINRKVLSFLWPGIFVFFFLTTSTLGHLLLFIVVVFEVLGI